jgi:hypothetical protein
LINTIDEGALPIDEVGGFDEHGSSIAPFGRNNNLFK